MNVFSPVQTGLAGPKMDALYSIQKGKLALPLLMIGASSSRKNPFQEHRVRGFTFFCVSESFTVVGHVYMFPIMHNPTRALSKYFANITSERHLRGMYEPNM